MKKFNEFIKESSNTNDLIEKIKQYLIDDDEYDDWEDYIDHQKMGDCQMIVSSIIGEFPNVVKVFGEIEVDEPYLDEDDEEQVLMTHHWCKINNEIYDFSKGTLKDAIEWKDLYSVDCSDEEWRYNPINVKISK